MTTPVALLQPDVVFQAGNGLALLGWIALALVPAASRHAGRARFFAGRVLPALLALPYLALFVANGMGDGGYGSLAEVQRLFASPALVTAGWLHYLAFDLFVGTWIAERAGAIRLAHVLLLPLLALTFLFGPVGLLAFFVVQAWRRPQPAIVAA
jgi:hypothetical protein